MKEVDSRFARLSFGAPPGPFGMEFSVIQGDIAEQQADALVNAAGTSLRMGSGVAGALREVGGEELGEAAVTAGPVDLGAVAVTDAYALEAEYVIHAAAMPHYGDGKATRESIRQATANALATADDLGCESLVIPALRCGVAGFPLEEGARIICGVIAAHGPSALTEAQVIGYSAEEYATIESVAESVRQG